MWSYSISSSSEMMSPEMKHLSEPSGNNCCCLTVFFSDSVNCLFILDKHLRWPRISNVNSTAPHVQGGISGCNVACRVSPRRSPLGPLVHRALWGKFMMRRDAGMRLMECLRLRVVLMLASGAGCRQTRRRCAASCGACV